MGRSKGQPRGSKGQLDGQGPAEAGRGAPSDAEQCGLCGKHVAVEEEEHIAGHCSKPACGGGVFHTPCVVEHLEKTLKASKGSAFGSKAWASVQVKLRQRPHAMFASNREQKTPQRCPSCKEGFIESAEPIKPEAARKLSQLPPQPEPPPLSPRGPRTAAASASRQVAPPATQPAQAAAAANKKTAAPQQSRASGNGVPGHGGNGRYDSSGWGGTRQYVLRPAPPPVTSAWAASSAGVATSAASLSDVERQEAERAARLRADAQAREEAILALSTDALDAMRAHKRRQVTAMLAEMGYDFDAACAAAEAAGGSVELAAHLLMGGALSGAHAVAIRVTDEARELLELGARLGAPPTEVEEGLMHAEGDWSQAAAVLTSAAAAKREAAAAAAFAWAASRHGQAAGPATATEDANYGWGAAEEEPAELAVPAAPGTAIEGDNYGWGPGPKDCAHATQAAALEDEEWEAVPSRSEWDTVPCQPGIDVPAHQLGCNSRQGYSPTQAVDSYGWPVEPEQAPPVSADASFDHHGGARSSWAGQSQASDCMGEAYGRSPAFDTNQEAPGGCGWDGHWPAARSEGLTASHQPSVLQRLPPHLLAQRAAPPTQLQPAAALSPFAAEYHPTCTTAPVTQPAPAVYNAPQAQPAPAVATPAPQTPLLPHLPRGRPGCQHPAAAAAVAQHTARAKYRPRLPYHDSVEEEVVGDLLSALGI